MHELNLSPFDCTSGHVPRGGVHAQSHHTLPWRTLSDHALNKVASRLYLDIHATVGEGSQSTMAKTEGYSITCSFLGIAATSAASLGLKGAIDTTQTTS